MSTRPLVILQNTRIVYFVVMAGLLILAWLVFLGAGADPTAGQILIAGGGDWNG